MDRYGQGTSMGKKRRIEKEEKKRKQKKSQKNGRRLTSGQ
jgi:hypothetical protein